MNHEKKGCFKEKNQPEIHQISKRRITLKNPDNIYAKNESYIKINFLLLNSTKLNINIKKTFKLLLAIYLLLIRLSTNNIIEYQSSNITLKIKGPGTKYILNPSTSYLGSSYYPNKIYINKEEKSPIKNYYEFNQTNNIVELMWDKNINDCGCMFKGCSDITEIDLSFFDTSLVTNIGTMFSGCSSLTSINLANMITSNVKFMDNLFNGCSLLTSLDLSNFDTSQVINMDKMFFNCEKLEYINMENLNENNALSNDDMFYNLPTNSIICINQNSNKILSQLNNIECFSNDCSNDWQLKQKKIVNKTGLCVDIT